MPSLPALDGSTAMAYGLGVVALGCLFFVASPYLSGDVKAEKRREAVAAPRAKRVGVERVVDAASRRKQVADSLKEVENRGKTRRRRWRSASSRPAWAGAATATSWAPP